MKKISLMPLLALYVCSLCSCSEDVQPVVKEVETVPVTFSCRGDFDLQTQAMTRGELTADGKQLTDIWILDYVGEILQQQLHQVSTDADFGTPTLNLSVGNHNIYFVASRGKLPTLNTDAHTITFATVLDTFYKSLSMNVLASSANGSQNVELDRCVTKMKVSFTDAIAEGAATINIKPHTWYYAIDYLTGEPTGAATDQTITINIPASEIGSTTTTANIFGFSGTDEWTTDISLNSKNSEGDIIGSASITAAPFRQNRITSYSGPLFSGSDALGISLSSEWLTEYNATW